MAGGLSSVDGSGVSTAKDGYVEAGPGGSVPPSSLPPPTATTLGGAKSSSAVANQFVTGLGTDGALTRAQPVTANLSDAGAANGAATLGADSKLTQSQVPLPAATTLGGAKSSSAVANQFVTGLGTDGALTRAQPVTANLSDAGAANGALVLDGSALAPLANIPTLDMGGGKITNASQRIATIAALRAVAPTTDRDADVRDYAALGAGGSGLFYGATGAAPGTYVENGGSIILPTGGNGSAAWLRRREGTISLRAFGAVGDGTTDDTAAIQAAIDYAATNGLGIEERGGSFKVTTITIKDGVAAFIAPNSTIVGVGAPSVATVLLGTSGTPLKRACVSVKMDLSGRSTSSLIVAIQGYAIEDCTIEQCVIENFPNSPTYNHYGIVLFGAAKRNAIRNNVITTYTNPTVDGIGMSIQGDGQTAYGRDVATGLPVRATTPIVNNVIEGNRVINGSHGLFLLGGENNSVIGNIFVGQAHRCIYLGNASWANLVSTNQCLEFGSTAILINYGSSYNYIVGNNCRRTTVGNEAAINLTTTAQYNLISGNNIDSVTNYGIYISTDSIGCTVQGNSIRNQYLAAICVENDWVTPRPTNASYSRPNYEAPLTPFTKWSYFDLTDVVIRGNTIGSGYTGRATAALACAQIDGLGHTKTSSITFADNIIVGSDNVTYDLHIYEDTASSLTNLRLKGNIGNSGNTILSSGTSGSTTWRKSLEWFDGNSRWDKTFFGETITLTVNSTTPSVAVVGPTRGEQMFKCANTSATSITNFTGGYEGQIIHIRLDSNTTIVRDSAIIRTTTGANIAGSSNVFVSFKLLSSIWFQQQNVSVS